MFWSTFLFAQILPPPATFQLTPPAMVYTPPIVIVNLNTSSSTVVYRDPKSIDFKAGFQITQGGNSSQKYFLAYINVPGPLMYAELEDELDDAYSVTVNSQVTFKYEERYNVATNATLNYAIYNAQMQPMPAPSTFPLYKTYGINYFTVDLTGYNYVGNQYYILIITGEKGDKKYLRFKYIPI